MFTVSVLSNSSFFPYCVFVMFRSFLILSIILLLNINLVFSCGYKSCPTYKSNSINVHLVPHSHDDVGWLKTVDQYYYGAKNNIQNAGVQYILDSVVQQLWLDPSRRFIYVETAFLMKWWKEQTLEMRTKVRQLIDQGRLEIIGGAWSMNDEATTYYQSIIDQFSLGLKALHNELGVCARPRVGWQIDTFGHSSEMASIFAQMYFDGEFFGRVDWLDKTNRLENRTAEMIWKADPNLDKNSDIFTGLLYNHYSAPPSFCFDVTCQDEPIIDGESTDNNVHERVTTFLNYIAEMQKNYRSTHLLVPMGDDFNYVSAHINFKNMDKLIKYVNARQQFGSNVHIFYSTPSCYLKALHDAQLTWPIKTQDFFPYSTDWHSYWTGFYSSRPTQKRFERFGNHMLQVAKQLAVFAELKTNNAELSLNQLREAMGVWQHHDAITGTERQLVALDYYRLLTSALQSVEKNLLAPALRKLTNYENAEFSSCLLLNISYCEFTASKSEFLVTLFNPLSHETRQYVRIPVQSGSYEVFDAAGGLIKSQLLPLPQAVLDLENRPKSTQFELVFAASIDKIAHAVVRQKSPEFQADVELKSKQNLIVQNSQVKLKFSASGHLVQVSANNHTANIRQDFFYYKAAVGNNSEFRYRSSGAYIFRPNGTEQLVAKTVKLSVFEGDLVKEVHQTFNNWLSQVIRIYEHRADVEFEWLIGPIPIADQVGKEIITRITSDINSGEEFYTDINGRGSLKRLRNKRVDFRPNMTEFVAGNYYPITTSISIQDEARRLTLLTDRSQGGSSLASGSLELMLHRRLLHDDAFGVDEALNEKLNNKGLVARGKLWLLLQEANTLSTQYERLLQQQMQLPFWLFFSKLNETLPSSQQQLIPFSSLPLGIEILTLEPFAANEILLRLENLFNRNETTETTINIAEIFESLKGKNLYETTLDGNLALQEAKRLQFQQDGVKNNNLELLSAAYQSLTVKDGAATAAFDVTLQPKQIRTFIIQK